MKILTIGLQSEMNAKIDSSGNIVIEITDACKRDLWDAQISYWLEDGETLKQDGFIRLNKNKLKMTTNK